MLSDLQRMMSPATADSSADLAASAARVFSGIKSLHVVCKTGVPPEPSVATERQMQKGCCHDRHGISSAIASLHSYEVKQSVGTAERVPSAFAAFACAAQQLGLLACATLRLQRCACLDDSE